MKRKILSLVLSIFVAATVFTGCAESVDNNSNKENYTNDVLELKLALYSKVLGTWENIGQYVDDYIRGEQEWEDYYCVIFSSNSITFDGQVHPFTPSAETILLEEEVPEEWRLKGETFYFYLRGKYYPVIIKDNEHIDISYSFVFSLTQDNNYKALKYTKKASGDIDNPGTDLDFSVEGDWSYTVTGGAKTYLTLNNDNTFSFVNKLNNYKVSGNYTLSGNTITFDYSKDSQSVNESFTITGSEDSITLTYKGDSSVSLMFVGFYGSIDKSITLSK